MTPANAEKQHLRTCISNGECETAESIHTVLDISQVASIWFCVWELENSQAQLSATSVELKYGDNEHQVSHSQQPGSGDGIHNQHVALVASLALVVFGMFNGISTVVVEYSASILICSIIEMVTEISFCACNDAIFKSSGWTH